MTSSTPATDHPVRSVTFADETPLMVWRTASDGACTYCSPAWLRFTGRTLAQELGQGWLESVHEDDRDAHMSECRQAFGARRGFLSRFRARCSDGVYRAIVAVGAPRVDLHGELQGFDGTCVDISEQVSADGHLPLTVDRLRLHTDYTAEVVYRVRVHPAPELEYISASVHRMTGHRPDLYYELYRHPEVAEQLVAAEDQAKVLALVSAPDAQPERLVLRWKHADGRTLWVEQERTAVHDDQGQVVAIIGVARDVSRQKLLEQEGHEHAALLAALVAHLDATLVESHDGQTILTNRAFVQLFGLSRSSTTDVREPSPDAGHTQRIRERGMPSGERVPWPDGRVLRRYYTPVRADGVLLAHMWRYVDVTATVQSEKAWLDSKSRLRELAVHAEAVRETERRQVARMLHDDLGQTFTGIRLELVSALARCRESAIPAQSDLVVRLQNAAGLIDLSIATLQRISTSLRPPVLDHLGLVEGIRWEAAEFERRSGIRCRVSALPKEFELDRDRSTAVYRILLEALNNVARHSHAGAVRIALLRRVGVVMLKVEDNGRGIRFDEAVNPRTMGLLGMRERARPFGGDVRVGPGPRGGTRVLAIFPL